MTLFHSPDVDLEEQNPTKSVGDTRHTLVADDGSTNDFHISPPPLAPTSPTYHTRHSDLSSRKPTLRHSSIIVLGTDKHTQLIKVEGMDYSMILAVLPGRLSGGLGIRQ